MPTERQTDIILESELEFRTFKTEPMGNEPAIEQAATYTKGEWYVQKNADAYTNIVRCNNGKHETLFIASTPQSDLPEAKANARLMAAAPDLLECLKEIIAISDRDHIAWVKGRAAIEKAIGNQSTTTNDTGNKQTD